MNVAIGFCVPWTADAATRIQMVTFTSCGSWRINGYTPGGSSNKPLAVYLHGTDMVYDNQVSREITEMMANKGFVAVNIEYANADYPLSSSQCTEFGSKAQQISAGIETLCTSLNQTTLMLDCTLGVAMMGYSQGGQLALLLGNYNNRVTAALSICGTLATAVGLDEQRACFASSALQLPRTKRRITIGEEDAEFGAASMYYWDGSPSQVIQLAAETSGYNSCSTHNCIQSDGSGFYVSTSSETGAGADHTWWVNFQGWFGASEQDSVKEEFKNAALDEQWGLPACLDWLARAAVANTPTPSPAAVAPEQQVTCGTSVRMQTFLHLAINAMVVCDVLYSSH